MGSGDLTGSQRSWFLRQMELDTAFLRDLHVLDYSLLVAFQLLHEDEKDSYNVYSTMRCASPTGAMAGTGVES